MSTFWGETWPNIRVYSEEKHVQGQETKKQDFGKQFSRKLFCCMLSKSSLCCILTTIMISITTVQQIHIQYIFKYKCRNRRTLLFRYEPFINFWLRFFDTRRETQFLKVFHNHTMLTTPPHRSAHLVVFYISIHLRWLGPKKFNRRRNGRKLNFQPP